MPGETLDGWLVFDDPGERTGIVYCDRGFGPKSPWGLITPGEACPSMGMDSGWSRRFMDAYLDSFFGDQPPDLESGPLDERRHLTRAHHRGAALGEGVGDRQSPAGGRPGALVWLRAQYCVLKAGLWRCPTDRRRFRDSAAFGGIAIRTGGSVQIPALRLAAARPSVPADTVLYRAPAWR